MLEEGDHRASSRFEELLISLREEHDLLRKQAQCLQHQVIGLRPPCLLQEREWNCGVVEWPDMEAPTAFAREESPAGNLSSAAPKAEAHIRWKGAHLLSSKEDLPVPVLPVNKSSSSMCPSDDERHFVKCASIDAQIQLLVTSSRSSNKKSPVFAVRRSIFSELSNGTTRDSQASRVTAFFLLDAAQLPCWKKFIYSDAFEYLSQLAILLYTVFILIETQDRAINSDANGDMYVMTHTCFNTFFVIEFVLRFAACGRTFLQKQNREFNWNCLDTMMAFSSLLDTIFDYAVGERNAAPNALRLIRLARILRTCRFFRTLRTVHELHKMSFALLASGRTLLCSLCTLVFIIYFFAIIFCQGVTEYRNQGGRELDSLTDTFGDLAKTFYFLFAASLDGFSWHVLYALLYEIDWMYGFLFIMFVVIISLGVLNVVAAIFVESALAAAQHDKDIMIGEKKKRTDIIIAQMRDLFKSIDVDGSGTISRKELEHVLKDAQFSEYLGAFNIDLKNSRMLFKMLDADGGGQVDIDEFCEGCLRLQGDAKSIDVHTLIYQMRHFLKKWSEFAKYLESPVCSTALRGST